MCHCLKTRKSKSFLRKSSRNCPLVKVFLSQKSVKSEKSVYVEMRTVRQRLFIRKLCLFVFFTLTHNDRDYVHVADWRVYSLSHYDEVNAGDEPPKCYILGYCT
jgi:hypothetical protein